MEHAQNMVEAVCSNPDCPKPDRKYWRLNKDQYRKYCSRECYNVILKKESLENNANKKKRDRGPNKITIRYRGTSIITAIATQEVLRQIETTTKDLSLDNITALCTCALNADIHGKIASKTVDNIHKFAKLLLEIRKQAIDERKKEDELFEAHISRIGSLDDREEKETGNNGESENTNPTR